MTDEIDPLAMLMANAETNEEKVELRAEFAAIAAAMGLRIGLFQAERCVAALIRRDGSAALWAELDPDGPHGEAFVDLGCPPNAGMVRLINIVIGAPAESLDGGQADDRLLRAGPGGALRFGFGDGVDFYPGDAVGVDLHGPLDLVLSPAAGCWFITGEAAGEAAGEGGRPVDARAVGAPAAKQM